MKAAETSLWEEVLLSALWDVAHARNRGELGRAVYWFTTQHYEDICFLMQREPRKYRRIVGKLARHNRGQRRYWFEEIKKDFKKEKRQPDQGKRRTTATQKTHIDASLNAPI